LNYKNISVIHFLGKTDIGGIEKWLLEYFSFSKSKNLFLCTFAKGVLHKDFQKYAKVFFLGRQRNVFSFIKILLYFRFNFHKDALFHFHMHSFHGLLAFIFLGRKRVIIHFHNSPGFNSLYDFINSLFGYISAQTAKNLIFCSSHVKRSWSLLTFYKKNCLLLRYHIIQSHPSHFKKKANNVFFTIGRLSSQKNQAFLIRLFTDKRLTKNTLHIYGNGPLKKNLQTLIKLKNLTRRVFLKGAFKNIWKMINKKVYQAFLLPSNYEGFPRVLYEAQLAGFPCVASSKITREFSDQKLVKFVPLNKESWVNAINQSSSKNLSYSLTQRQLNEFSITYCSQKLRRFYESLLR